MGCCMEGTRPPQEPSPGPGMVRRKGCTVCQSATTRRWSTQIGFLNALLRCSSRPHGGLAKSNLLHTVDAHCSQLM